MRINLTSLGWLVTIVVLTGGVMMQAQSPKTAGTVCVSPAIKQVQLNETFDLFIAVDAQVKYFKSFEVYDIEVDTNVIRLIAATREAFFTGPFGVFFFWKDTVQTFPQIGSRYVYEMVGSILGYEAYVDGPGQVVRMTFQAVGYGVSDVIFRKTEMLNWHDSTITMQDSLNGQVVVGAMPFLCGDANGDGSIDISDAVYLISYIFSGGAAPVPLLAGDANCDHAVDVSDVVYLISYIFSGGRPPCYSCP
jgi:hypothetical protein